MTVHLWDVILTASFGQRKHEPQKLANCTLKLVTLTLNFLFGGRHDRVGAPPSERRGPSAFLSPKCKRSFSFLSFFSLRGERWTISQKQPVYRHLSEKAFYSPRDMRSFFSFQFCSLPDDGDNAFLLLGSDERTWQSHTIYSPIQPLLWVLSCKLFFSLKKTGKNVSKEAWVWFHERDSLIVTFEVEDGGNGGCLTKRSGGRNEGPAY